VYSFALGEQDNKLSLEHSNLRDGTVVIPIPCHKETIINTLSHLMLTFTIYPQALAFNLRAYDFISPCPIVVVLQLYLLEIILFGIIKPYQ